MKIPTQAFARLHPRLRRWRFALCCSLLLALAVAGCGGGVDIGVGFGWYSDHDHPWPDHPDWPSWPDRPQGATGLYPIAGDICGTCSGSLDGTGGGARFNHPEGMAVDGAGNLYTVEPASDTVRRITPQGVVTTLAGSRAVAGHVDGDGAAARFSGPSRIASDAAGNLWVADSGNHTVRRIDSAGNVSTVAGNPGVCGSADGRGGAARFCNPQDIAVDQWNNVYVVDTGNSTVRMLKPNGDVSTLAGQAGQCGAVDGSPTVSRVCAPSGIAIDGNDLYIADTDNATIRRIKLDNVTSTVAGVAGKQGILLNALPGGLDHPIGIVLAPDGSLALTTHNLVVKLLVAK